PHLKNLAAASSAGTSLVANLKHITVTLATWDAVWEVYLDPNHRVCALCAWLQLEEDMAEVSMVRHGRAKQLVVFFGAASIGTKGGWGADAVLRACGKVQAKPAQQPGRWLDRYCNAALNMQRIGESRVQPSLRLTTLILGKVFPSRHQDRQPHPQLIRAEVEHGTAHVGRSSWRQVSQDVALAISAQESGQLVADQLDRWKLTKGQVKHANGLNDARRTTQRWLAPIQPHLKHLAAASSAGTSLVANLEHITVTLATWDAARQKLRLYGAQDRALEQFFKQLEEDMAEAFMERHGRVKQLVVYFGAASIGTKDWKPPAGKVDLRLLRPAWSQQRDQPVRGLMWCPVVAPRKPPQAPCSSQEATPTAASEPGPSTPPPAKRSKRTEDEQAAEPTQPTKAEQAAELSKGKAAKAKPTPQPGRWLQCSAEHAAQWGEEQLGLTEETKEAAFTSEPALSHHWARWFDMRKLANKEVHFERTVETDGTKHAPSPLLLPHPQRPAATAAQVLQQQWPMHSQSSLWDQESGQLVADQLDRWKLTKGQVKHANGLNDARRTTQRWLAPIQPHLKHLAAASSAGTSLVANLKHITVTLATWDAARQKLRLYGAQDRALEQFFKQLEEDMAEAFMERHGRVKQLVVYFGAASIGTKDWKPPAGKVDLRLLRPAWSQQRDQPVRGLMWCPVVAPRKPPQAPCSSQEATPTAASEPGPSTPPPAKRSKRTEDEQAAEPTQPTKAEQAAELSKGKAAKAKPTPQPGRWLQCSAEHAAQWGEEVAPAGAVLLARAGSSASQGQGYKWLRDKPPKAQQQQQQQQAAAAQHCPCTHLFDALQPNFAAVCLFWGECQDCGKHWQQLLCLHAKRHGQSMFVSYLGP
ncbi:hypothetical protein QJQ45_025082, partial [Haematococcus lacustris]